MTIAVDRPTVAAILEKALGGERISDDDAATLLRSRDLVAVGRVANEIRNRKVDPGRVTFIVDRNINYTNVCVTDCDFCAFYRSPGDTREGYLLPKPVMFKKIEETLAIGGTGVLMQGGAPPGSRDRVVRGSLPFDQEPVRRSTCTASPRRRSSTSRAGRT